MKFFFSSARFQMAIPKGVQGVNGAIIYPSGIPAHTLNRRSFHKHSHLRRRLMDPQVYLAEIPAALCRSTCANLASYGWFGASGIPNYNSSEQNQNEWKRNAKANIHRSWIGKSAIEELEIRGCVLSAVVAQRELGCEFIVLPSPLIPEQNSDLSVVLQWLDAGITVSQTEAPGTPKLATVALSDNSLRGLSPDCNGMIDALVDQITARDVSGVYIVLEQSTEDRYYCTHPYTVGSLLHLVHRLKQGGLSTVVVGHMGFAGLLAAAVGADIWSTGWYRGERRLRRDDLEDREGRAMPTYYSHVLGGEIHLERDLDKLASEGVLAKFEDETEASLGLLQALRSGRHVKDVPQWAYQQSNVSAAKEHFLRVAVRETENLAAQSPSEGLNATLRWLETANSIASEVMNVGGLHQRTEVNHQACWLQAFRAFRKHFNV